MGDKVKINIDPSVTLKFCKAQPFQYAMKEMVERVTATRNIGDH